MSIRGLSAGTGFAAVLQRSWWRRSWLSIALWPISLLFGLAVAIRRILYRWNVFESTAFPVPVIVVGNLTVGGAGKTPLTIWIARLLRSRGFHPGVLSRGYGGSLQRSNILLVTAISDPHMSGDEPVLLAHSSECPVVVGQKRVAAGRFLLSKFPACDVLICDDGLQHLALRRDLEIAVEDERGHGNGWLLPAGPMRESARRRVDATVINGANESPLPQRNSPVFRMRLVARRLAPLSHWREPESSVDLASLKNRRVHAVAGIGDPSRFFRTLRDLGIVATEHAFGDHHAYVVSDLIFSECDAVVMTEKDAVKCERFAVVNAYVLTVEAELDPSFEELMLVKLGVPASTDRGG